MWLGNDDNTVDVFNADVIVCGVDNRQHSLHISDHRVVDVSATAELSLYALVYFFCNAEQQHRR